MLVYICLTWFVVYISSIFRAVYKLKEIANALNVLIEYLDSASINHSAYDAAGPTLVKKDHYRFALSNVLNDFPLIQKYSGYYCGILKYGASDIENYRTAIELYNQLSMEKNYLIAAFKKSFNPFRSVKTLFLLPDMFLSWLGISLNLSVSRILNVLCWIIVYIFGLYGSEIKAILNSILKNFI